MGITEQLFKRVLWKPEFTRDCVEFKDKYIGEHPFSKKLEEFVEKCKLDVVKFPPPKDYWGNPVLSRYNDRFIEFKPTDGHFPIIKATYDIRKRTAYLKFYGYMFMKLDKVKRRSDGKEGIVQELTKYQDGENLLDALIVKHDKQKAVWLTFEVDFVDGVKRFYE